MSGDPIPERPLEGEPPRDGIGEEDHPIPAWFNLGFYGLMIFGLGYIFWYGAMSPYSQSEVYAAEVAAVDAHLAANRPAIAASNPYRGDREAIAAGAEIYKTICIACHLGEGQGLVGPSLVDPYWKYGNDDAALFETVTRGRPLGMPGWGQQLGAEKVWKVLAFIETLEKSPEPGVGSPEYEAAKAAGAAGG